jgi:hypothetical protein
MAKKTDKSKIDTHNRMSMDDLENVLLTNCKLIMDDPKMGSIIPPLLIHSSPGIGKSSIVKEVAKTLGIQLVDVRLAEMESVDIRGLPSIDKNANGDGIMKWNAPDCWPRDPKSKGIIFLDEITSCDKSCQVAAYELILDRKIGDFYKVPEGWYIVSAGNLTTDRAVATSMSSALANRFLHIELKEDPEQWIKWGIMNEVHPSVLGFINYRPEFLFSMENENLERGWPSPRSWERVSHMVKIYENDEHILRKMVYGLVGPAKGLEFMEFHKLNAKFKNVLDMMYGKIPIEIPEKNDQIYALCSTLIYQVWRGENESEEQKRITGFYNIIKELPPEFTMMCINGALYGRSKELSASAAKKMLAHPLYKTVMEQYRKHMN